MGNSELAQAEKKGDVDTKWVKELEKKEAPPEPKKKDLKPEAKLALQSFKKKLEKAEDPQEALQKKHDLYKKNVRTKKQMQAKKKTQETDKGEAQGCQGRRCKC